MGSVAQAVVEFDESVQAPWRPPLAGTPVRRDRLRVVPEPARSGPVRTAGAPGSRAAASARRTPAPQTRRPAPAGSRPRRPAPERGVLAPGLRLTRRARRLGVVLGLAVGVVVGSWLGAAVAGGDEGLRLVGESSVVVQPGDTLWSIAGAVAHDGEDVRAVISRIRELNGLPDASLVPGQRLVLP